MKTLFIFFLSAFYLISVYSCHKKKDVQPQLPNATQIGAGTFGCKINGQIVTANYADHFNAYAVYQFLSFTYPYESGYFLIVHGENRHKWYILLSTDSLKLKENSMFSLSKKKKGSAYAIYTDLGNVGNEYYTNDTTKGELKITKLDSANQIISGTFWFDAVDTVTGNKVEVRDGRFDLLFTR